MSNEMWGVDPKTGTLKHYGRKGMAWGHNYFNPNYKPIGEEAQGVVASSGGAARRSAVNSRNSGNYAVRETAGYRTPSVKDTVQAHAKKAYTDVKSGNVARSIDNALNGTAVKEKVMVSDGNGGWKAEWRDARKNDSIFDKIGGFFQQSVATVGSWITKGKDAITSWAAGAGEFIGKRVSDVSNFVNSGKAAFDKWWNGYSYDKIREKPDGTRDRTTVTVPGTRQQISDSLNDAGARFNQWWNGTDTYIPSAGNDTEGTRIHNNGVRDNIGNAVNAAGQWIGDRYNEASGAVNNGLNAAGQWIGDTARVAGNRVDQAAQQFGQGVVGRDMVNNQRANGDVMDYNMGRMPVHVNGAVDNMRNAAAPIIEDLGNGLARIQTATGNWITDTRNNIEDYLRSN